MAQVTAMHMEVNWAACRGVRWMLTAIRLKHLLCIWSCICLQGSHMQELRTAVRFSNLLFV